MSAELIDPLKKDFRNFLYVVWKHLGLPEPTRAQYALAYYLQHSPRKFIMAAFRGVGKSYITVAYAAWLLYKDPQHKIMVVSASEDRAIQFSIFVKALINDMPILQHLKARSGQRDSNLAFDVGPATPSGSPSVKSVGITGQLTGSRADTIFADDIEIPKNSATHELREKLAELVKEFAAVIKPGGKIVYLGTPQTEMSLYNLLETRGYTMKIWCARYPTEEQTATYGARLAQEIMDDLADGAMPGTSTDVKRFTDEDLLERELEYGKSGFQLQFMLDTTLSDANKYPLKINDLIVSAVGRTHAPNIITWSNSPLMKMKEIPNVAMAGQSYYSPEAITAQYSPFQAKVLAIDPSGRGADETGYAVGAMLYGNIHVPAAGGVSGGYSDQTMIEICNLAKLHAVNEIIVESNFGDGMFTSLLTPHVNRIYPVHITEVRHSQQKELRIIETLEPVLNQHRLIIDPKVIQEDYDRAMALYSADKATQYMLFYQLARVTKSRGALKHDDRLDALAIMVKYFTEMLALDQTNSEKQRKEDAFDDYIQKFINDFNLPDERSSSERYSKNLQDNILKGRR